MAGVVIVVEKIRGAGVYQYVSSRKFGSPCMSSTSSSCRKFLQIFKLRASSSVKAGNGFCSFCSSSNPQPSAFTKLYDSKLAKAIVYEANKGFCDSTGSTAKFSEFLNSQLSIHAERTKSHQPLQHLAEAAKLYGQMNYEQRVDFLDKVAQIQGFSCAKEIVENEIAVAEASEGQTPLECREGESSVPAIVYGNSERIEIFNFEQKNPPLSKPSSAAEAPNQNHQPVAVPDSKQNFNQAASFPPKLGSSLKINGFLTDWTLDTPLSQLKCLTTYQKSQLQENGFYMARSLLNHFPRAHISFKNPTKDLEDGQLVAIIGKIVQTKISQIKTGLALVEVIINCTIDQGSECENIIFLHFKRFFQGQRFTESQFLHKIAACYPEGSNAAVRGKVKAVKPKNHFEMRDCYEFKVVHEDISKLREECEAYPVYPSKSLLNSTKLKSYIERMLASLPSNLDPLPSELREKYGLLKLEEAYLGVHYPSTLKDADLARRRMVFDDYFYLQLAFLLQRQGLWRMETSGLLEMENWSPLCLKVLKALPFKLTDGQINAVSEIMWDIRQPAPMSRLLQGEVGCGKTVVAFLVLLDVVHSGYQAALMTPTEFVAAQHYKQFESWLEFLDVNERPKIALLSAGISSVEARLTRERIAKKEVSFVVGTHSLISRTTTFPALGLAVVDEQHRFGVLQRELLKTSCGAVSNLVENESDEGKVKIAGTPHILLLSATPIPRSMALTVHGDLSLSRIAETPPGRQPTETLVFSDDSGRKTAYELVRRELEQGGRAFFVYPLITEANGSQRSATADFKKVVEEFKEYKCALVHGRMKPDAKQEAMKKFREGECQILVSTKIVEVGIDISEATVMLIENAELYGISQLHQLRGRVGRGKKQSFCILLSSCEAAMERLRLLQSTTDGFTLAEADLEMRGPGDLLGKRQSGNHVQFVLARLGEDNDILDQAKAAAMELLESCNDLVPRLKQEINVRQLPKSWS